MRTMRMLKLAQFAGGHHRHRLGAMRAQARDYPTRPIQVIVPFAGGSASDVVTRIMLHEMSKSLDQNFVVDNRPGAGGNTGTAAATQAAPDGYTLVMSTSGPLAANKTLFKNLGYDPEKDLTPISLFAILPNVIVINSKLPPKTLTEFIAYAKAHPKQLNYGSVGVGSSQHLAAAYFEQITGVQLTHVPYRNIAQYTPDFLAGEVPARLPAAAERARPVEERRRACTRRHQRQAHDRATRRADRSGSGREELQDLRLACHAGTGRHAARDRRQALQGDGRSDEEPAVIARFTEQGAEPVAPGPEELAKFMKSETVKLGDIIHEAGIKPM